MENAKKPTESAEFLDAMEGQGLSDIGFGDTAVPFLKILQKGSPEQEEGNPSRVAGAVAGTFMNTLTKKIYGKEIDLIPIKFESVWLCWAPNRGGFRGKHKPGTIETFGSSFDDGGMRDKEGNEIVENFVFYCLVAGHLEDGPIVVSLASTGAKHAKNWNSMILMTRLASGKRAPFFSSVWKLSLVFNQNQSGTWFMIGTKTSSDIKRERFITADEYNLYVAPARAMLASAKVDFAQISEGQGSSKAIEESTDEDAGKY